MANIKSNKKSQIHNEKTRSRKHGQKSALKTQIKKTKASENTDNLSQSYKKIDSSLSKGIITKNKANRLKSRITKDLQNKKSS